MLMMFVEWDNLWVETMKEKLIKYNSLFLLDNKTILQVQLKIMVQVQGEEL